MKSFIKKVFKIIIKSVIIIIFIVLLYYFHCNYNYVYYVDEREKDSTVIFFNKLSKETFWIEYLQECSSIGSAYIPKEIGGLVYTEILIISISEITEIKIKDCRVEIRDTKNQVIPYKSVVIQDEKYYNPIKAYDSLFTRYSNIDEYLKTDRMIDRSHTNYAIYYTYLHKNLKDVNEVTLDIDFKYEINGKTYEQKIEKNIYRRVKRIGLEYTGKWAVPDKVEE